VLRAITVPDARYTARTGDVHVEKCYNHGIPHWQTNVRNQWLVAAPAGGVLIEAETRPQFEGPTPGGYLLIYNPNPKFLGA
jgi:hypothetical protein